MPRRHEGVFPFHDGGNYSGGEDGTNVHGLFGALVVEPAGSIWRDPVTGRRSREGNVFQELDGLYVDILPENAQEGPDPESNTTLEDHAWPAPEAYTAFDQLAHREFVIVFHDEPEFQPPHGEAPTNPCAAAEGGDGGGHGNGGEHETMLPIMPISYRAEPMINREHTLWGLLEEGHVLTRPVLNEEQHHSSWMFGDPATPILKAYIGDPVRIRLLHAGVLETHVFHLHLYEWHAVPEERSSPRIDAISISPQTGHTIEPLWGAGNRQQVAGDAIWHCHLYPHFHEGMWGIFRTFETRQDGAEDARGRRARQR
ncbi:MAG TPA: multicopper oxidase domain-containing protein [Rhodospirillales bacterium]|nr:multicopper oxidase domain-containing protein [Rhodospirillales bacterium]